MGWNNGHDSLEGCTLRAFSKAVSRHTKEVLRPSKD